MGKSSPGLRKKGKIWHIDKTIEGIKLRESTGETNLAAAERYLIKRINEIRNKAIYGERNERTFYEASARFIDKYGYKRSIDRDIVSLKAVMPYIGELQLRRIHTATLEHYVRDRIALGISAGTLNRDMAIVRRVLKLSSAKRRDKQGKPWLDSAPLFPSIPGVKRKPHPITKEEERKLLMGMPQYLADMTLFALHTGLRD